MTINYDEKLWLRSRGDRRAEDVFENEHGKYVLMGDGLGGEMKVYVPASLTKEDRKKYEYAK